MYHQWLSYDVLSHHMMSIYPTVRIQFSFVQYSLLCYEFCILSKTECKSIYYHFRRDYESGSFRKLARNKWICREICDFFSWSIHSNNHGVTTITNGKTNKQTTSFKKNDKTTVHNDNDDSNLIKRQSENSSAVKKDDFIIGDSMIKYVNGQEVPRNDSVKVRSHPGASNKWLHWLCPTHCSKKT